MSTDLGDGVIYHPRAEWAGLSCPANINGGGSPRRMGDITEYIVHHSGGVTLGDPDPAQWICNIWAHHVRVLGYVDVAYEAFVDERGHLWQGRGPGIGSAATFNHNARGYACCLLRSNGDRGDDRNVPIVVQRAFRKNFQITQYAVLVDHGGKLAELTHKRASGNSTACPEPDLDEWVAGGGLRVPFGARPKPPSAKPDPNWPKYPGTVLANGSRGTHVKVWKDRLRKLGFGKEMSDRGVFGENTVAATRAFQKARKLKVDGKVGPLTWAAAGR